MTELQQKQLAFLEETVAFYNLGNRCVTEGGSCRYYIEGKDGCAIGRRIADKALCERLDNNPNGCGVINDFIFEELPRDLRELGRKFLQEVQTLHDEKHCWTETGISEGGLAYVQDIKERFGLL